VIGKFKFSYILVESFKIDSFSISAVTPAAVAQTNSPTNDESAVICSTNLQIQDDWLDSLLEED